MFEQLKKKWFLLLLLTILVFGGTTTLETSFRAQLSENLPRGIIVAAVLFLMALPLELRAIGSAIRRPGPAWWAIFINAVVAPPLAWLLVTLVGLPPGLAIGTCVAAIAPCTLASAAIWTRRAGGNDAIPLVVTVITNFFCFLVAPFWIWLLFDLQIQSEKLRFSTMTLRIGTLVVLPMVLAQTLRLFTSVRQFSKQYKTSLGVVAQLGILSIVYVGAVRSGLTLSNNPAAQISVSSWVTLLITVAAIHLLLLRIARTGGKYFRFSLAELSACSFAASQKTLMIGLDLALILGEATGYAGITILPMVAYHILQLVLDTFLAARWKKEIDSL